MAFKIACVMIIWIEISFCCNPGTVAWRRRQWRCRFAFL